MKDRIVIAVTENEYRKAEETFSAAKAEGLDCLPAPEEEDSLAGMLREVRARHAIVGLGQYRAALYDSLSSGSVLARFGVGFDGIDLHRATQNKILCTNTPGVLAQSVAEHAFALILCAARGMSRKGVPAGGGTELAGKTLAVIGCGVIGCRVARIADQGFGMCVIGCETRDVDTALIKREYGFKTITDRFEAAVEHADFVSLHLPLTPSTKLMINVDRLHAMRRQAWLINTARGDLIDERALFDVLVEKHLAGAALDVTVHEPYQPLEADKDLSILKNVVMTPHIGSTTREACRRMAERALQNVMLGERGEYAKMDLLNPEVLL